MTSPQAAAINRLISPSSHTYTCATGTLSPAAIDAPTAVDAACTYLTAALRSGEFIDRDWPEVDAMPVTVAGPDRARETVWIALDWEPMFYDAGPPEQLEWQEPRHGGSRGIEKIC